MSSSSEFTEGAVCMPNIGPAGRARRNRIGVVFGVVTAGLAIGLIASPAPRLARLAVFLPAVIAAYSIVQAREKT